MTKKIKLLKSQYSGLSLKEEKSKNKFSFLLSGKLGESTLSYGSISDPKKKTGVFGSKRAAQSFFSFLKQECFGVSYGFYVNMYLQGVGYRVWSYKKKLLFKIGYNHLIKFELPSTMQVYSKKYRFLLFGIHKQEVNSIAKRLFWLKVPDSYKGKGMRYANLFLKLKETKDAKKK